MLGQGFAKGFSEAIIWKYACTTYRISMNTAATNSGCHRWVVLLIQIQVWPSVQ